MNRVSKISGNDGYEFFIHSKNEKLKTDTDIGMTRDGRKVNGLERSNSTSNPKKIFKILSIDGGGIKGLYPVRILQLIEEQYDINIADQFDMICGTSTGGLIALSLSIGKPASEIVSLYQEKGPIIFREPQNWFQKKIQNIQQCVWGGKYSGETLKEVLTDFLGENTLKDASTYLCIPSFNLTVGQPRIFKKPHNLFFKDSNITMVDAALATSAAPTYLPIHQIDDALYCDGGMWANNPILCGLVEALDYFVGKGKTYDGYSILSLPTIPVPKGWSDFSRKKLSILGWKQKIIDPAMEGQAFFHDYFAERIIKYTKAPGTYYRVPHPNKLSEKQLSKIAFDNTSKSTLKLLTGFGDQIGAELISKGAFNSFITHTPKGEQ